MLKYLSVSSLTPLDSVALGMSFGNDVSAAGLS
jgi:hypothetical protein